MNKKEPRVDFYILSGGGESAYMRYICRLTEKAYKLKHRIYIHVNNRVDAHNLDQLLWTFSQDSFIPHECLDGGATAPDPNTPIVIAYHNRVAPESNTAEGYDLLINLNQDIPEFYQQFDRVAEVVADQDRLRQTSRDHFRCYREQGLTPNIHQISL